MVWPFSASNSAKPASNPENQTEPLLPSSSSSGSSTVNANSDDVEDPNALTRALRLTSNHQKILEEDGSTIYAFRFARLVCVCGLVGLSVRDVVVDITGTGRVGDLKMKVDIGLLVFYVIIEILSCISIASPSSPTRKSSSKFASLPLVAAFTITFFRDVWPYFVISPAQPHTGVNWETWTRVGLLTCSGFVVPLFIPQAYTRADASTTVDGELIHSLFSRITFAYLDRTVWFAYKRPKISTEDVRPLESNLEAHALAKDGMNEFDPIVTGNRYMGWGLLHAFGPEYAWGAFWLFISCLCQFLGPFAMQNLLTYLESPESSSTDGTFADFSVMAFKEKVVLQPWFWIILIALAPMLTSLFWNRFIYNSSIIQVKADGLLSQIIFEHTLRIRLTSETTPSDPKNASPPSGSPGEKKPGSSLVGTINNLLTSDLNRIKTLQTILIVPGCVFQVILAIFFLYRILGWSALVGLGVLICGLPAATLMGKKIMANQRSIMAATDQRVQITTETLSILRTLKLLAWEGTMLKQLSAKRELELKRILVGNLLDVVLRNVESIIPLLSLLATFGTYTLVMRQPLNAATAFPALSVFNLLNEQLSGLMYWVTDSLRAKVSIDRFNDFLTKTDILVRKPMLKLSSDFVVGDQEFSTPQTHGGKIGFHAASFTWKAPTESSTEAGSETSVFKVRCEDEVVFQQGKINLIIGPTASGKTSLLMALLGEMHYSPLQTDSWYNLPRDGGVAYAPQESWVLNATVKDNIVFNQPFDEVRYKKVLQACALERDLSLWDAGDLTEVGEKGLTLSGGQKARVTLARALYSRAAIVLLDDPLAALDVHTARDIVHNALQGELVKDRTIILVTHNIPLAAPIADYVVAVGRDGRAVNQGSIKDALKADSDLKALAEKEEAEMAAAKDKEADQIEEDAPKNLKDAKGKAAKPSGKLIVQEEKAMGRVEYAAIMLWVNSLGGVLIWGAMLSLYFLEIVGNISETWFVGYWSSLYDTIPIDEITPARYLVIYALIVVGQVFVSSLAMLFGAYRSIRGSRIIYNRLLKSILNAPLRWLDTVPVGRIITRCTQDIGAIDGPIPVMAFHLLKTTLELLSVFIVTVIMTGWPALISGALVGAFGGWVGSIYLTAQIAVKREMSNAKSPVVSQVGTSVAGIVTIRAYDAHDYFRVELARRINANSRISRVFYDLNRWVGIRIDMLGAVFAAFVASFLVYGAPVGPSAIGFTITMVFAFNRQILNWVRVYNMVEIQANSLERVLGFLRIEQEPEPTESGKPPAYWPSSGNLRVENLSASYSEDGPLVLRDVSFDIKAGERVGVVGRTGAGKSSITLALLRAIPTTGKVFYDNIPTDRINLDALRSQITLIPQQPELIRGSLRENLDPAGECDDAGLNDALRAAGLFNLSAGTKAGGSGGAGAGREGGSSEGQTDEGHAVLGLDASIESGGSNVSLGQRQIISLARAILRRSKVLILDEATAAIDYETDAAIQKSLRTELSKDTTVITIAHRLQTIMDYDKILVLDAGQVAEFDRPVNLLKKKESFLRALVDGSDDREKLLALAGVSAADL